MPRSTDGRQDDLRARPALLDVVRGTGLNRQIHSLDEGVVLTLLYTRKMMDLVSQRFFAGREVTEAEFGALMILYDYRPRALKQAEIARMLLVSRLSARDVLTRLERKALVELADHPDRRARALRITDRGRRILRAVREAYYRMIAAGLRDLSAADKEALIDGQYRLRGSLRSGLATLLERP